MKTKIPYVIFPLAIGLMMSFAFQPLGLWFLAVPALSIFPFFRAMPPVKRWFFGWLTGFFIQALGYTWIFITIRDFGGLSGGISAIGAVLFWAYQGLDFAIWFCFSPMLFPKHDESSGKGGSLYLVGDAGFFFLVQSFLFPYVFPWAISACLTESPFLPSARFWSANGLTFLIMLVGLTLGEILRFGLKARKVQFSALLLHVLAVVAMSAGLFMPRSSEDGETVRVGVVQPNIIPWAKRERASFKEVFDAHVKPTLSMKRQHPDLVIWPETALMITLKNYPAYITYLQDLSETLDCGLMIGTLGKDQAGHTNEVWLFSHGKEPQICAKEKLVMFSESLPWPFFWARYLVPGIGGFHSGSRVEPFELNGVMINPLICFEAILPHYVAKRESHLLVNITNDAWFGKTKASALHLQHLQMRTVENGIPLVRAANSGISCWVTVSGEVIEPTGIFEKAVPVYDIPVPSKKSVPWWIWLEGFLLVLTFVIFVINRVKYYQSKKTNATHPSRVSSS